MSSTCWQFLVIFERIIQSEKQQAVLMGWMEDITHSVSFGCYRLSQAAFGCQKLPQIQNYANQFPTAVLADRHSLTQPKRSGKIKRAVSSSELPQSTIPRLSFADICFCCERQQSMLYYIIILYRIRYSQPRYSLGRGGPI